MSKEIKIGLIGSGFVGQVAHLHCFNNLKNSKIIALSELRPRLGEKVCKKYNIPSLYSDYKEMIKENNLDLIIAIVKRYHTAKVAHDVLNRNINLFTEKPMAPTLLQAKKLLKISKKKKLKYVVGNMRRFDHGVQILKKYLKQNLPTGELGHIVNFRCYCIAGNDYCNIDGNITTKEPSKTKSEWPRYPEWIKFPKEGINSNEINHADIFDMLSGNIHSRNSRNSQKNKGKPITYPLELSLESFYNGKILTCRHLRRYVSWE